MELQTQSGTQVEVADALLGVEFKEPLIHQVVTAYLAGARAGTKAQKTRSQVAGGGAKPWRQKGTGRARAGTIRSPIWRGGGATFAASPRDHSQKVNRKAYRLAMRSILSELLRQERLVVVDQLVVDAPKTKQVLAKLADLGVERGLLVTVEPNADLLLGARNIPYVNVCTSKELNPAALVGSDKVVITVDALKAVEGWLV